MSITSPGVEVGSPKCVAPRFGLFSVAEIEDVAHGHWEAGFYHEQLPCDDIQSVSVQCVVSDVVKDTEGGVSYPESDVFALVAPNKCSTGGAEDFARAFDLAGERLARGEMRGVERAFWTGVDSQGLPLRQTLGGNPDVVDLTPISGAVSITDGFAMLESWAGENMPCSPVLHAGRGLGVYLAERSLTDRDGDVLVSVGTGSRVSIGGGYLVSGPNGVAADPGEAWLFISGAIKILRSPIFYTPERGNFAGAIARSTNDVTVFAERMYGIETDCGMAAIRVNLKSCCC